VSEYAALTRPALSARPSLGERVRQLRVARGLTQTELAGDRFSKEYVSQIERGKTRPTGETIEWLAERLGVDRTFLEIGVSSSERERVESAIARAEAAIEDSRYGDAVEDLDKLAPALATVAAPELELRAVLAESWARMYQGEVRKAIDLLNGARTLAEGPSFTDVERADLLYRLGCCRYKLNSISTAVSLYSEALDLATRSGLPSDRLRSHIHEWRSRCYRRQRDWEAAREDVERALELAEGLNDRHTIGHVYFQASLIAERTGHWVLARSYAERAKAIYEELRDNANVGKLLNEIGALNFQLGKPEAGSRAPEGPRRSHRRDWQRPARPRARPARAGALRGGGAGVRRRGVKLRSTLFRQSSRGRLDRPGRPRGPAWRRQRCERSLPTRG
jgi:transcriptional regulator with XRE-family HTH domain